MNLDLTGKHAIVCGASQGIGFEIAKALAELGATITLVARHEEALEKACNQLPNQGHLYEVADFFHPDSVQEVALKISKQQPIHILINNTGGPPPGPVFQADIEAFRVAFNQHLICNQILASAFIPNMKIEGYGRIINIISTSVKQPLKGLGVSNTIRGAVANWAKTLAMEVAPWGITVNNVLPGATFTQRLEGIIQNKAAKTNQAAENITHEMLAEIPMGRFAKPEEIAAAAAFLATPAAAYINGINLPVDGGRTLCL